MAMVNSNNVGQRCFIVANGPSINAQDLTLLKDEIVICMSSFYKHKDYHLINPKYYFITRIQQHFRYGSRNEYIQLYRELDEVVSDLTIMILDDNDKNFINENNLFINKEIIWLKYIKWNDRQIDSIDIKVFFDFNFVSEGAIQLALYLEFENIFLLGFDHDWFNGALKYFDTKKVRKNFSTTQQELVTKHYLDSEYFMYAYANTFRKYKALYKYKQNIFNANVDIDSYVDVFPKIKYKDIFSHDIDNLLKKIKKKFAIIPSCTTQQMIFSSIFSYKYTKIVNLSLENKKYLIYGEGTFGKTIEKLIPNNIVGFIDRNTKQIDCVYDYIIIGVLGREDEIIKYLKDIFNIQQDKIITI